MVSEPWVFLWAVVQQTTPTTTPPANDPVITGNPLFDVFISFGPIGAVLVAAAMGYIWFKPSVEQLKEDKKLLQETNANLISTYEKEAIPALHEAVLAVRASAEAMSEMKVEIASMRAELTASERAHSELLEIARRLERRQRSDGGST